MYVCTVAKQMMTDHFLAQHDFSQDPVFVKSKGHLVRQSRILVFCHTQGFGFSVPLRRIYWEI